MLRLPACQKRFGRPDLGVYRSWFAPLYPQLGPLGRRESAPRLQRRLRRLSGAMEHLGRDRQRNRGFFSGMGRSVSDPREGLKILTFLFRSPLVCSSLLHIRSSWKVNSSNFAITAFSEVRSQA